ncbi:MAG: 2-oxo acid dehydrogenase subunit E2, partial [Chitinophagaceae bacterium]|nr:2-oxo acid dehydrogenase subunit E2 [Chitinophagaceae bacterium]
MSLVDLVMPKLGESIMEATILKWHKQPGDKIAMDETVLEIATDKVDSEVPSTAEGVIEEILFNVNDVVPIGTVIARIKTSAAEGATTPAPVVNTPTPSPVPTATPAPTVTQTVQVESAPALTSSNGQRFYSPLVLNIAASEGVSMAELERMPGTGNEGRVTKKDILQYVSDKRAGKVVSAPAKQAASTELTVPISRIDSSSSAVVNTTYSGNVEIIEMDRMRKLIADHMVKSKQTSPHVTSFTEADVTNIVMWRNRVKKEFEKRENTKITFTPLFIEAIVKCIKKFPLINSSVDGDRIIIKKDINIGMATALQNGNLIVPVIKGADQLNLVGLTKKVNQLADNARNGKLSPDDTMGGTFTLT